MATKWTTFKLPQKAGITDLRSQYPGGQATEWWTEEDWEKWRASLPERKAWDEAYIAKLHAEGRFGEEYHLTLKLQHNPMFDDLPAGGSFLTSYRMVFLDFDNETIDSL